MRILSFALLSMCVVHLSACSASVNVNSTHDRLRDGGTDGPRSRAVHVDIAEVLDDWHHAAAVGELEPYIGAMTEGAIFLGTDSSERWTRDELQAYAEKYFGDGEGWVYVPRDRYIRTNAYGDVAWVDEILDNEKYGEFRGTAVLRQNGDEWRIAHYSLTFLVPNDRAKDVVDLIRGGGSMDSGG
ncbi:MAG: nuclear transport factor 2 family protein [Phycisphaerales bacterium]|nr:nuclear transport factor 2 family protein [Phycisphaerales bacterium]